MPIPKPTPNEDKDEFIGRCMSTLNAEYPDNGQRYAICNRSWADSKADIKVSSSVEDDLKEALIAAATDDDVPTITEVYITDDDRVYSKTELLSLQAAEGFTKASASLKSLSEEDKQELLQIVKKSSTQSQLELNRGSNITYSLSLSNLKVVEPPFPPEVMTSFLEVNETHFRCVRAKVIDAIGRDFILEPTYNLEGHDYDTKDASDEERQLTTSEIREIRKFISTCNNIHTFVDVLDKVATDYEAVGWGAIEVVRSRDFKVRKIFHVPATRIKVLEGWKGFVEDQGNGNQRYFQNFGEKVVTKTRIDLLTGRPAAYDPDEDGPIVPSNLAWNGIHKDEGTPTDSYSEMANEIIWIPKVHSNTIYYGYPDVFPALGSLFSDVHIRDYTLQFFEHNTVPRYAIIIQGAKLTDAVKNLIQSYFSEHVKGKAHKTLIIPIESRQTDVSIKFEKLDADVKESSFQETRKNNGQSIMVSHGVSPAIIGVHEAASLGSGKGLSQAEIYKDRIVTPSQSKFSGILNKLFKLGLGVRLVLLKFNPLDIRDRTEEMKILTGYLEKGATTINRVIRRADLGEPLKGGDIAFVNNNGLITFIDDLPQKDVNKHLSVVRKNNEALPGAETNNQEQEEEIDVTSPAEED